jgi:hypothetical protein
LAFEKVTALNVSLHLSTAKAKYLLYLTAEIISYHGNTPMKDYFNTTQDKKCLKEKGSCLLFSPQN